MNFLNTHMKKFTYMLRNFFGKFQNWILSPKCVLCSAETRHGLVLCVPCEAELPRIQHACIRCALPLFDISEKNYCGQCLQKELPFTATVATFHYKAPIDHLITAFKFQQRLEYGHLLSNLLQKKLAQVYADKQWPEYIVPVPLHPKRLRERGFNQALELAKPIAKQFKLKIDFTSCERIVSTAAQSDLPAYKRQKNMRNAFYIKPIFRAKHVAIIDDVITTGCTVTELSQKLREIGVEKIDVWCCARTLVSEKRSPIKKPLMINEHERF